MSNFRRKPHLYLVFFLACFLVACQKDWDLMIVGDKVGNAVFCFSLLLGQCTDRGDQFNTGIRIDQVDPKGDKIQSMWSINCLPGNPDNCILKRLEYGLLPQGWEEQQPAEPLSNNTYYSVNDYYYFSRDDAGEYSVMKQGKFYKSVVRGE